MPRRFFSPEEERLDLLVHSANWNIKYLTIMSEVLLNINTIRALNVCANIPLPLFKLVVTTKLQTILGIKTTLTNNQLLSIFRQQEVSLTAQQTHQSLSTLESVMKFALTNQYTVKALSSFLKQNTVLGESHTNCILKEFASTQEGAEISRICPRIGGLSGFRWRIFNCKSDQSGETVNKMYVKMELVVKNKEEESVLMYVTLPEFKAFIEEVRVLVSNASPS